ncbi:MAG: aldolase/citrate lyase family protein [Gemmatimonadaceae bacterium]|jgi:2-keto-3-deoxy-L-rhamnonate aldolase RhmA|nr:aldolase/citrate lyase family protein [Gemmatimonadaceae bacterium]
MRVASLAVLSLTLASSPVLSQRTARLNPVVDLLAAAKPVFGLYAPANRRARPGMPADTTPPKSTAQLASEAMAYPNGDLLFDGSMEGDFDAAFPGFAASMAALDAAGMTSKGSAPRMPHPVFVKTHKIGENPAVAVERIGRQLNEGVAGVVFVEVESAEELKTGLAAMRFKAKGGTRADGVGAAPARWGMTEAQYRAKADLWPLNPSGELVNWTIVETKAGLAKVREIAAVPGIGALFPGAGSLRGVFTTTDAAGKRVFDEVAWENAIQQVLAACKEFKVPCGYPANERDIEKRMQQGFSVFIIGWGEAGFRAVDIGRKVAGR